MMGHVRNTMLRRMLARSWAGPAVSQGPAHQLLADGRVVAL